MCFAQFRVERDSLAEVIERGIKILFKGADEPGKVMGFSALTRVTGPCVAGGLAKILEGFIEIDQVIEVETGD